MDIRDEIKKFKELLKKNNIIVKNIQVSFNTFNDIKGI